jgi:superfamily II DNA or RNA helicase
MNFTLRDYQEDFTIQLAKSVAIDKHIIGQSPGGTGKTPVFINICRNANSKGRAAIILTERIKVFEQAVKKSGGIPVGNGIKHVFVEPGKTYVCMAQTLSKRPRIIEAFNELEKEVIVCVDECHIGTFSTILNKLSNRMTIGFSATPDFRIAKHLPVFYKNIVCTHPIQWFIDRNYLCDYQHIQRKSGKGTEKLEKRNGEFTESSQRKFFGTESHYIELFNDLKENEFKKCMFFTASIEHAEEVFERLTKEGLRCSIAHSKRKDEPFQLAKFQDLDETNILISVSSLTTGYDYADVDLIVLYRATTSLSIYLQMLFRADRPKEGMFFRCLDYGSNFDRHGAYFADHDWKEMWNKKARSNSKEDAAAMTTCPQCESMISVSSKKCKFCGFLIPEKPRVVEPGIAEDVTKRFDAIAGKKISQLTPKELSLFANLKNKKMFAIWVAKSQEQSNPGFLIDFAACMGYKRGWLDHQTVPQEKIEFLDITLQ